MAKRKFRKRSPRQPLGLMCGLLAGSIATLIGVFSGLEPFVILLRATAASFIIGITVSVGMSIIHVANIPNETKANQ